MGELGDFFGAILSFFSSFSIFFTVLTNIGFVFKNFLNFAIALPIFILLSMIGYFLQIIIAFILFVPMFITMSMLTLFLLCVIFLVYLLFTIVSVCVALLDLATLGHINPLLRRTFACSMVSDDWYNIAYQHMGNKYDRLAIAGLCYGCLQPCSGARVPKKIHGNHLSCVPRGSSQMKKFTPCAAVYKAYIDKVSISTKDVEDFPFNHTKYVNLANTIVKFVDFVQPGTNIAQLGQSICSSDPDYCAATHSIGFIESFMRTEKSGPFYAAFYALAFTIAFITVTGIYYNVRGDYPVR